MCSPQNKMLKNTVRVWAFNRTKRIHVIYRNLCTTTNPEQEDDKSLTKEKARTLIMNLTIEERDNLAWSLNHLESEETKAEYRGSVPKMVLSECINCNCLHGVLRNSKSIPFVFLST